MSSGPVLVPVGNAIRWVRRVLLFVLVVLTVFGLVSMGGTLDLDEPGVYVTALAAMGFGGLTALLVIRVPENRISWLVLVVVLTLILLLDVQEIDAPEAVVESFFGLGLFGVVLPGLVVLLPLWFPTGYPPSPAWRWVAVLAYLAAGAGVAGWGLETLFGAGPDADVACTSAGTCLQLGAVAMLVFASVAAAISFVVRWRGAAGVERLQLQWLVPSFVVLAAGFVAEFGGFQGSVAANFLLPTGLVLVFASIAIAVLRYRLYEIQRILSRTASYGIVVGLSAGVFAGVVLVPTAVVGSAEAPSWLVAMATLVVFSLFDPLRRGVQRRVDRRFDRVRYDAQLVVDGFVGQMQDAIELVRVRTRLAEVVGVTFRPSSVGVWIREGGT